MLDLWAHDFMIRALIVGLMTSISSAFLGNFIVASRQSTMVEMLAHTGLAGVGLGFVLGISPYGMTFVFALLASWILVLLSRHRHSAPEAYSVLLLSGGIALAVLFAHIAKNSSVSLHSYLFGSLLTVTPGESVIFLILNLLIICVLLIMYRPLIALVFDREWYRVRYGNGFHEYVFMCMIAILVSVGLKVIGGLLMVALLVIPAIGASHMTRSFHTNIVVSICINMISVFLGVMGSYIYDIPTGSAIVLCLILIFALGRGYKTWIQKAS